MRVRAVSPVELVAAYADRIERFNPLLGAFLTVCTDDAMEAAKVAEHRLLEPNLPPFHGVPIAVKDLNDTAGIRTTHGSALFANHVPDCDGAVVSRLKNAGFIVREDQHT